MKDFLKGSDCLGDHVFAEVFIVVRIEFRIYSDQIVLVQTQPLARKSFAESPSAKSCKHATDLASKCGGIAKLVSRRQLTQTIIGRTAPQEVGQAGTQAGYALPAEMNG